MVLEVAQIEERLKKAFPRARIIIEDTRGDGFYLAITVSDVAFAGLNLLDQHRAVYKALGEDIIDPPPSLSLRTLAPA